MICFLIVVALTVATLARQGAAGEYRWNLPPPGVPPPRVPVDAPMTAARVEFGRYLFYDTRLSGNGTQSCATYHVQALPFTDGRSRAIGSTGDRHPRSSMPLVNVAYRDALTWANPTLRSLDEQVLIPMFGTEPGELGLGSSRRWASANKSPPPPPGHGIDGPGVADLGRLEERPSPDQSGVSMTTRSTYLLGRGVDHLPATGRLNPAPRRPGRGARWPTAAASAQL